MTAPLQIFSISDYERIVIYKTYTRESVAIVQQQRERLESSPFNVLAANQQWQEWSRKSHIMLPNYVLDHIDLPRQEHKRMYESPTIHQSYPAPEKTEINDAGYLKESPRKTFFRYDCDSIPLYENYEGSIRDYAEREGYWDVQTTISSPDSTVPDPVTPISSILASELGSGTQSSITPVVDLATPETPPVNACYAPKKRTIEFKQFWKLKKLYYIFNLAEFLCCSEISTTEY